MLNELRLKNIALITEAEIAFDDGLNVLSGETGAGKSVILDSINFVLGAKADKSMIRYGEQFCLAEARFTDLSDEVKKILIDFDVEDPDEIVIKRKFDVNGNGYIKLNGENVTATMLKKITSFLVDVHGQSDHFVLLSKTKQLECVDQGAGVDELKRSLKMICEDLSEIDEKLEKLGGDPEVRARKIDMLDYQIDEISSADLKEGEEEKLLSVRDRLLNAEKIRQSLSAVYSCLCDENGATDSVISAEHSIKPIANIDERFSSITDRLNSLREELSDVGETAKDILDEFDDDSVDPDEIERRLDVYKKIKRKYGASLEEITKFLNNAVAERDTLLKCDDEIQFLATESEKKKNEYYRIGVEISEKRKEYAKTLSDCVTRKLSDLGMAHAKFVVDFSPLAKKEELTTFSANGLDRVEFMFSANAGEEVKPLSKIISGGEMSRFMLALKTQAGSPCDTYIFDEIDAGISGLTAGIVAENFAELASNKQIIAISHLAQIASMSDRSFLIEKTEKDGKTYTTMNPLNEDQKLYEVVRLIGGKNTDVTALDHAKNLIRSAKKFKSDVKKQGR